MMVYPQSGHRWRVTRATRLTSVQVPGFGTVTFQYDPFGRRIQKSSPLGTTNYLYDGANLLEELNSSGSLVTRYTQGLGIDEPLAEARAGVVSFYQADGLGSVTSLTNAGGQETAAYSYNSFGALTAASGRASPPHPPSSTSEEPLYRTVCLFSRIATPSARPATVAPFKTEPSTLTWAPWDGTPRFETTKIRPVSSSIS